MRSTAVIAFSRIVQMGAAVVRSKAIALLLGPVGMGINGLYNSAVNVVSEFCAFGLGFSAVREISENRSNASDTFKVISVWLLILAFAGAVITVVGAPLLSQWAFDNTDYAWGFRILGAAVFFNVIAQGQLAMLQGMRAIKSLALASTTGALVSIATAVPLYWVFGDNGIPWAITAAAVSLFLVHAIFVRRLRVGKSALTLSAALRNGREMMALGGVHMSTRLLSSATLFAVNAFISFAGSLFAVGLYQAGSSITLQYSSVVFSAMASEYFPRLTSLIHNRREMNCAVNDQIKNSLLIMTPMVAAVMSLTPFVIWLLLSEEFHSVATFIVVSGATSVVKSASFPVGYLSFAHGDKKTFFWLEGIGGNVTVLLSGVIGFLIGGINGIAWLNLTFETLYLVTVVLITRKLYGFDIDRRSLWQVIGSLALILTIMATLVSGIDWLRYIGWSLSALTVLTFGGKALRLLRNR